MPEDVIWDVIALNALGIGTYNMSFKIKLFHLWILKIFLIRNKIYIIIVKYKHIQY